MYRATPLGRKVLLAARERVSELFGELWRMSEISVLEWRASMRPALQGRIA